jgi:alkanesulfonate monooxygenase SsuD/methylene tetrahydromethanopterin reductase-like flavin-dependent oxidoreductase (luciferase family)
MSPQEHAMLNDALACSFVGTPATIRKGVSDFVARTGADELMIASQVFDHAARLRCFEIARAELS